MFREFHYQVWGRGHVLAGTRGQDRTCYLTRGGIQVLCLSDGAGSATHSEFGAQALVEEGCRLLADRFSDFIVSKDGAYVRTEIVARLLARLEESAGRLNVKVEDLAATFLAVGVSEEHFFIVHVGDGVIGLVRNGESKVASGPDNSEFANQTTFLTSEGAASTMRLLRGTIDGVAGFILMSDGTAHSLYNTRTRELAPACLKLVATLASAPTARTKNPEYKKQLRKLIDTKIRHATKDDCSIGILAREVDQPLRARPMRETFG